MSDYNRYKKCKSKYKDYIVMLEYENSICIFDIDAYIVAEIMEKIDDIEILEEYEKLEFSENKLKDIEEKLRKQCINYVIMRIDKNILTTIKFNIKNKYENLYQSAKISQYIKRGKNAKLFNNPNELNNKKAVDNNVTNKFDDICFSCMKYRCDECFGDKKCDEYKKAPDVSKEEQANWPVFGDATYYKLKRNHKIKKFNAKK